MCVFKKAELVYWGFDYLLNEFISYYLVISPKKKNTNLTVKLKHLKFIKVRLNQIYPRKTM